MSAKRDYYEVLGVTKTSSQDEIKSQYRKLALKFHPDRNKSPDAADHFKEISEAYAVLSDSEKRKLYDQHGHAGIDGRYSDQDIYQGASANFNDIFQDLFGSRGGFNIFDNIFGGMGGFRSESRGSDILYETSITLQDVLEGKKIEAQVKKQILCQKCNATGCEPGSTRYTCKNCNGQGQVRRARKMGGFASFVTVEPCRDCNGTGSIIEKPCKECKGQGNLKGEKTVSFDIPPGIDSGDYTIPNEGDEIAGGRNGDLIVRVRVQPDSNFRRDGADLIYEKKIDMIDAALGIDTTIPTLEKEEKIKIEEGCQPNTIIKLKGKGLPHPNSRSRGDIYVKILVNIPTKLSKHQKNMLKEFRESS